MPILDDLSSAISRFNKTEGNPGSRSLCVKEIGVLLKKAKSEDLVDKFIDVIKQEFMQDLSLWLIGLKFVTHENNTGITHPKIIMDTLKVLNVIFDEADEIAEQSILLLPYFKEIIKLEMNQQFLPKILDLCYKMVRQDNQQMIERMRLIGLSHDVRSSEVTGRCKMLRFLFLLYVEKGSDLKEDIEMINQLIGYTQNAVQSKGKTTKGFRSIELLRAFHLLITIYTVADRDIPNKLKFMQEMEKILKAELNNDEVLIIVKILERLALITDKTSESARIPFDTFLECKYLKYGISDEIKTVIMGIECILDKKINMIDDGGPRDMVLTEARSSKGKTQKPDKHVMISYCWKYQKKVRPIKERLEAENFKIWYDENNMRDNDHLLKGMADAVENAWVFLLCYGPGYGESGNCLMEVSYAKKRNVPIIPVLMEENYEPDGWLGLLIALKLYYKSWDLPTLVNKLKQLKSSISTTARSMPAGDIAKTRGKRNSSGLTTPSPKLTRLSSCSGSNATTDSMETSSLKLLIFYRDDEGLTPANHPSVECQGWNPWNFIKCTMGSPVRSGCIPFDTMLDIVRPLFVGSEAITGFTQYRGRYAGDKDVVWVTSADNDEVRREWSLREYCDTEGNPYIQSQIFPKLRGINRSGEEIVIAGGERRTVIWIDAYRIHGLILR